MAHHRQHSDGNRAVYRAAILRGAASGAVRALITWLFDH